EGHEPPYFISYQLKDTRSYGIVARYGAIFDDRRERDAKLAVDVRVGSHEFDSSEGETEVPFFLGGDQGPTYFAQTGAPHGPDPEALHNALWLLTDEKYKAALSNFLKRKAASVYAAESEEEKRVSFTKEAPVVFVQDPVAFPFDEEARRQRAR